MTSVCLVSAPTMTANLGINLHLIVGVPFCLLHTRNKTVTEIPFDLFLEMLKMNVE